MGKYLNLVYFIVIIIVSSIILSLVVPYFSGSVNKYEIIRAKSNINTILLDLNTYYESRQRLSRLRDINLAIPPVVLNGKVCLRVRQIDESKILFDINSDGVCDEAWRMSDFNHLKEKILSNGNKLELVPNMNYLQYEN
ncbi:hypothetical protein [Campylobacter mucosalis]|uniref:hypothetical protein n=1 Tax=Campylobacter mucosalis TaxID=202 RepID=UPI00146FED40|nr:hypothetical protein [Campylobacter mucosalis]